MRINLSQRQCRVIGVLLEKAVTTPEHYPLSLNALTNGCNQKSNRVPVMTLSENDVADTIHELSQKRLIQSVTGFGSRVEKYDHRFCNTEFSDIKLSEQQTAIITELLLRGPQTPGELRGRCQRMASFPSVNDVEAALSALQAFQPYALVRKLEREPGKREARFEHCFADSDEVIAADKAAETAVSHASASSAEQPSVYQEIERLKQEIADLKARVTQLENT